MKTVNVLDPTGGAPAIRGDLAPRVETVADKRVVLFWNAKKNGNEVLEGVAAGLRAAGLAFESELVRKDVAIAAASEELLQSISKRADVVINAVAD